MAEGPPVVPGPSRVGVPALNLELRSVSHLAFYVRLGSIPLIKSKFMSADFFGICRLRP